MTHTVEVLVVSYRSAEVIADLLASLASHLPTAAVAIREHASEPTAMTALAAVAHDHLAPVRIEHAPDNPGFGAGCNALARSSTADHLLFLNPDTQVVAWPWSNSPPPTGVVIGPRMVDSGDPAEHYGRTYRVRDEISRSWLRRRPREPDGRGYVSGAALLMDRASFERAGGFDEGFFLFYEDIDLCFRANDLGIGTVVEPAWAMRHARHHSTSGQVGSALRWSYESAVRFHARRGSPVLAYRTYVAADSALRLIWHAARRHPDAVRGYAALLRQVVTDVIRRRPPTL